MSLITRCPACATQFKVVPDQLKLSDGWVRCGHCSDVFDATRYLESWALGDTNPKFSGLHQASPSLDADLPAQPSGAVQSALLEAVTEEAALPLSPDSVSKTLHTDELDMDLTVDEPDLPSDIGKTLSREAILSNTAARLDQQATEQTDRDTEERSDFHIELKRFAAGTGKTPESESAATSAGATLLSPASVSVRPAALAAQQSEVEIAQPPDSQEAAAVAPEPSFMRQARRREFWRSPGVRALLTLVALLLSVVLAAQWALQERDRLAASHPDLQPLLASLCEPLGCTMGAVRDLQAVVIDSSSLTRRLGDFYSFDLVLKNTSAIALAVPALELSLTDTADTVISRRVFLPQELPGVPPLLPPQTTVPVSLRLSLPMGSELPMAGYRALVFYP